MQNTSDKSLAVRTRNFFLTLCAIMLFVYGFLPLLTSSFPILQRMSKSIEENGIDPSRYYYTDVEQVYEAEGYLKQALIDE